MSIRPLIQRNEPFMDDLEVRTVNLKVPDALIVRTEAHSGHVSAHNLAQFAHLTTVMRSTKKENGYCRKIDIIQTLIRFYRSAPYHLKGWSIASTMIAYQEQRRKIKKRLFYIFDDNS